jgi:putative ABC transport system ATP-binding protein
MSEEKHLSAAPHTAVEIRGLQKVFGVGATRVQALAGVDLDIPAGQFLAVMGPSGSGKSTLLHLVAGLDQPDGGSIRVSGQDILALSDDEITLLRRRRLGLVFQAFNLLDALSAAENVSLPLVVDGVPEAEAQRRAIEALERVGLAARGRHLPKEMSGGEQQRVAIARALAIRPVMLLADEPTGNLDTHNGDLVMQLLRQLVSEGQTILMVTHNPAHAAVADRIVTLRDGNIMHDRLLSEERARGHAVHAGGESPSLLP